jgi:hypothetical protein
VEYDFDTEKPPNCAVGGWNVMGVSVVDRLAESDVYLENVTIGPMSDPTMFDLKKKFSGHGWNHWTVANFDFDKSFTVAGDLVVKGEWDKAENNKVEIKVGCSQ